MPPDCLVLQVLLRETLSLTMMSLRPLGRPKKLLTEELRTDTAYEAHAVIQ